MTKLKKGTFTKAWVAECFECHAVVTLYKKGASMTLEEAERQREELGWTNTPKGFYCAACLERDAEEMIATVEALTSRVVDAVEDQETTVSTDTEQAQGTFKIINIEPTANGYRMIKQQFQRSVETYQEQLRHLELLLSFVQANQFGEATGEIHTLLEEMIAIKQSSIEEAIEGLTESIAELERGGY